VARSAGGEGMNVSVHIERLILDGVPVPHRHRPQLQAALEAELARLIAADGLAVDMHMGGVLPRFSGGEIQIEDDDPKLLGKRIAQAVYRRIGNV
jgi:hypothetical protein